jgi:hypothetical protein
MDTYICIHLYVHMYIDICMYDMCKYMYSYILIYTFVCIHIYICMCIRIDILMCIFMINSYIFMYTYTHTEIFHLYYNYIHI